MVKSCSINVPLVSVILSQLVSPEPLVLAPMATARQSSDSSLLVHPAELHAIGDPLRGLAPIG